MASEVCSVCGKKTNPLFMCDEDAHDNRYCDECFVRTGCRQEHGEGCETMVVSDGKS